MEPKLSTPWGLFAITCEKYPNHPMIKHNHLEYTYQQVFNKVQSISDTLQQFDSRVFGVYLPNSIEFITFLLALNKNKKIVVPLSYQLKGESLYERVNYSDVEIIITDNNGLTEILKVKEKLNVGMVLLQNQELRFLGSHQNGKKLIDIHDDIFGICFTSGSTSQPKGVLIRNQAIAGNALAVADYLKMNNQDVFFVTRSFTQAGPIAGDILMTICSGGCLVISNDLFHPTIFLKTIQSFKVTTTLLINTMLSMLVEYPQLMNYDLSSLKRIIFGGMASSKSMVNVAMNKLPNVKFYCTYGMTEASTRITFSNPDDILKCPGSSGRPIKGCEVKVYREDGKEAGVNEVGEIYVISDYVMGGYYQREQLTAEALTPIGLRTRDLGYKDEYGLLYVNGRSDDLIIQGGNNVFPIEIEEVLLRNSRIKEAVVLGIDDEILGSKIVAFVSLVDSSIGVPEVLKWCRANLEERKIPKAVYILNEIPKTDFGKINKNELKKILMNKVRVNNEKGRVKTGMAIGPFRIDRAR